MQFEEFMISEGINDKGIFKSAFMSGVPGGGKSYVLSKIRSGSIEPRIVNTDKLFTLYKDVWDDWDKIGEKVKLLTKDQLILYINSLLPLAIDGTSSKTQSVLRRKGLLEGLGYDADAMIFINVSLETALARAAKRDRFVPPEFIKETYKQMQKVKKYYKSKFSIFMEIQNDDGLLTDDVVTKAFNKLSSYYLSGVKNPVGVEIINQMRKEGEKYLIPSVYDKSYISNVASVWYKS